MTPNHSVERTSTGKPAAAAHLKLQGLPARGTDHLRKLFEEFCEQNSIRCRRVAVGNGQTPDYDIFLQRFKIVTEVKEIRPNAEERKAEADLRRGINTVVGLTPGDRVRKKISEADPQIRSRSKGRYPGLLVVFDVGFAAEHVHSYNIRVAMYGFETIQLAVPRNPAESPYAVGRKFGGRRKMTVTDNTSISAVAALTASKASGLQLAVYHNVHAAKPIDHALFAHYGVPQYRLEEPRAGHISKWKEVEHA